MIYADKLNTTSFILNPAVQQGHTLPIVSVVLSGDSRFMVSLGKLGSGSEVIAWDVATGKCIRKWMEKGSPLITSIALSPDGTVVLCGYENERVKAFDLATGKLLKTYKGHTRDPLALDFAPDGKTFVSGAGMSLWEEEGELFLWDVADGKKLRSFTGHTYCVNAVKFSQNGKYLVSGAGIVKQPGEVKIWTPLTGEEVAGFLTPDRVNSVAVSPDNRFAACGTGYLNGKTGQITGSIIIWDITSKKTVLRQDYTENYITDVHFSADGSILIAANYDKSLSLIDLKKTTVKKERYSHISRITSLDVSDDGRYLVSAGEDRIIKLWDISDIRQLTQDKKLRLIHDFSKVEDAIFITTSAFAPDGSYAFTGSSKGYLYKWDIQKGGLVSLAKYFEDMKINSLQFDASGKILILAGDSRLPETRATTRSWCYLLNEQNLEKIAEFPSDKYVVNTALSADNKTLVLGLANNRYKVSGQKNEIIAYNREDHKQIFSIPDIPGEITNIIFSPDDRQIVFSTSAGEIQFLDRNDGKLVKKLDNLRDPVNDFAFSPDKKNLIGISSGTIQKWNIESEKNELIFSRPSMTGAICSFDLSKKNNKLLIGLLNNTIELRDCGSGELEESLTGHSAFVQQVMYADNGKYFLTLSGDQTIKLWGIDQKSCSCIATLYMFPPAGEDEQELEYITMLPDTYYIASRYGAEQLYIVRGLDVINFAQFDLTYNRPDIVLAHLAGKKADKDEVAYLKTLYDLRLKRMGTLDVNLKKIEEGSIPRVTIKNPGYYNVVKQKNIKLELDAIDEKAALKKLFVYVNGVPEKSSQGIKINTPARAHFKETMEIELSVGQNKIDVSVTNIHGIESLRQTLYYTYEPEVPAKPDLYIIAIGMYHYPNPSLLSDLSTSINDAQDILDLFCSQKAYYTNIYKKLLTDETPEKPTKKNILALTGFIKNAGVDDTVILYASGHGHEGHDVAGHDPERKLKNYFCTYDTVWDQDNGYLNTLPYDDLESLLAACRARKKIIITDACHAGENDDNFFKVIAKYSAESKGTAGIGTVITDEDKKAINDYITRHRKNPWGDYYKYFNDVRQGAGIIVLASTVGPFQSYIIHGKRNSFFTEFILDGLKGGIPGEAKSTGIKISDIKHYIANQSELKWEDKGKNAIQIPSVRRDNRDNDFVLYF